MTLPRILGLSVGVAVAFSVSCGGGDTSSDSSNPGGGSGGTTSTGDPGDAGSDSSNPGGGSGGTTSTGDPGGTSFVDMCGSAPCCSSDADCSGATPRCGPGDNCAECTAQTEAEDCGDYMCAYGESVCSDRLNNASEVCFACEADTDCQYPMNCVSETFDGQELPPACIYFQTRPDHCPSRYDYPREATSVDGVTATYCFPPPTTTCRAVYERNVATCASHDDCGVDGLDDGYCDERGVCTIPCVNDTDCTDCSGDPPYCHSF